MTAIALVYKTGRRIYHVNSAFTHQRLGRMHATWGQRFYIKKLLWLTLIIGFLTFLAFPKVAAQWSNNSEPTGNQNSVYLNDAGETNQSPASAGEAPAKAEQPAVPREQKPSVAPDIKTYTKDEVQALIISYSAQFNIDPTIPLRIAYCESGYNWSSKNKTSSASGVFQFIRSTWLGTPEGKEGLSPFDADANVRAAIRKISQGGIRAWNASINCWK